MEGRGGGAGREEGWKGRAAQRQAEKGSLLATLDPSRKEWVWGVRPEREMCVCVCVCLSLSLSLSLSN